MHASHRIEKAVFPPRFNVVQFRPIVAQHNKGRNRNAKHIEHNHGNLRMGENEAKQPNVHESYETCFGYEQ
jgi:hypothetical protein